MTWLDAPTMSAVTALVVVVCGALYLVDTLTYASNAAARLWAVAFTCGTLTAFSYLVWAYVPGAWVAVAAGNAAFVATIGFLWLGCRRFNRPELRWTVWVVLVAGGSTFLAAAVEGPDGGAWAGAGVMFVSMAVLGALACVETRRAPLSGHATSVALTAVMGTVALYYVARTVVFVALGTESALFLEWFGTPSTSVVTIVLTITAVASMVVLRLEENATTGRRRTAGLAISIDGYLDPASFQIVLGTMLDRARQRSQTTAVIALVLADLPQISRAFGTPRAERMAQGLRSAIAGAAPGAAVLGSDGEGRVLVALPDVSREEAFRLAGRVTDLTVEALSGAGDPVHALLGVGVAATTAADDHDADQLLERARDAAATSSGNLDAAPVLAPPD